MEDSDGNDDSFILNARDSETIESLKGKIHTQRGIDSDSQRLIYNNKVLEDKLTVSSCNIQNGAILYLGLKRRGNNSCVVF